MFKYFKKIGKYFIAITVLIWSIFPLFWLLMTSFKRPIDTFKIPPKIFFIPTLENYVNVLTSSPIFKFILNSIFVSIGTALIAMILGIAASYVFSRYIFKGSKSLMFWILSVRFLPPVVAVLPFFLIFKKIGVLNHSFILILPYLTFVLPFMIWMMKSFFDDIPKRLDEAAQIDGYSDREIVTKVILPLSADGIIITLLFSIIFAWNEFLYALILTGFDSKTATVASINFITGKGVLWGEIGAVGVLIVIPVIFLVIILQKYLARGLSFGMFKEN